MRREGELLTELIDLGGWSLEDLRSSSRHNELEAMLQRILGQVERPRANLGSSGPPGRAD